MNVFRYKNHVIVTLTSLTIYGNYNTVSLNITALFFDSSDTM